jgi:hypothetical protein
VGERPHDAKTGTLHPGLGGRLWTSVPVVVWPTGIHCLTVGRKTEPVWQESSSNLPSWDGLAPVLWAARCSIRESRNPQPLELCFRALLTEGAAEQLG